MLNTASPAFRQTARYYFIVILSVCSPPVFADNLDALRAFLILLAVVAIHVIFILSLLILLIPSARRFYSRPSWYIGIGFASVELILMLNGLGVSHDGDAFAVLALAVIPNIIFFTAHHFLTRKHKKQTVLSSDV